MNGVAAVDDMVGIVEGTVDLDREHLPWGASAPASHPTANCLSVTQDVTQNLILKPERVLVFLEEVVLYGVPGVTRTRDPQFRKLLLYPAELRGQQ